MVQRVLGRHLLDWTDDGPSRRNSVVYYNEGDLTAVRIGPWKSHLKVRDCLFDSLRPSALVVNLLMDPSERHGGQKADDLAMQMGIAWSGQVYDLLDEHEKSLVALPPRQRGRSLRVR